jgi:uncharacterized membrane protein
MTRKKAYKENPEIARMTDFLVQHESKLKRLHKQYKKDTGDKMEFFGFVAYIYNEAQDLVLIPENN